MKQMIRTMKYLTMTGALSIAVGCAPKIRSSSPVKTEVSSPRHMGEVWLDTEGHPINAHGGCVLKVADTYYWYGEMKSGTTWLVPDMNWEDYRVGAGGISCYASKDLINWQNLGIVMKPILDDRSSDIDSSKVIERPKVLFNKQTGKYVMWMHIDSLDYGVARAGVAVADRPEGPFSYLHSVRPNGNMSRDMTVFQDVDGKAYHFYSSEDNKTMHITELSTDYLSHTTRDKRILIGRSREAPVVIKQSGEYFLITSACTGWASNAALCVKTNAIMGEWNDMGNPFEGPCANNSFDSQGTFAFVGPSGEYIFMADRWNKTDLPDSRYVWLPMHFATGKSIIPCPK